MKSDRPFRQRAPRRLLACLALALASRAMAQGSDAAAIADIPFEQLLQTEVITATKVAKQISDAPSAVSIVTADDIRTFGYRTLSDILDGMRGLSMAHDNYYGFLSGRGYGNPGSYSGRITLLIDGYRAPDNYYGQIFFGNDGLLDVELIDRVEYIPGSGSSSYGDSAFLGVVNIVTKRGKDIGATQVSTEFGTHGWKRNRATLGKQFESGLDLLLSVSDVVVAGRNPKGEEVWSDVGVAEREYGRRYFLKATYGSWTLESAWADRHTQMPYVEMFSRISDANTFTRLKFDHDLGEHLKTSLDFYYGQYRYKDREGDWFGTGGPSYYFESGGNWRGVDAKFVGNWFDRHTLVFGGEYRSDFKQVSGAMVDGEPDYAYATKRRTTSYYAYDDIALAPGLQLNAGARYDARDNGSATTSPRGALVYSPVAGTTLKLSSGMAHRQQTPSMEAAGLTSPVERVVAKELVWEQMFGPRTRLIGSLYRYRIDNYTYEDGAFGPLFSRGAEAEFEHVSDRGIRLRTSYAYQNSYYEDGSRPANLAHHIAKFNLGIPLVGDQLKLGLAARYLGRRPNLDGGYEPGVVIGDMTLSGKWNNWTASFSIRNIGDAAYNEVSQTDVSILSSYPADRRNFWFQLGYEFK